MRAFYRRGKGKVIKEVNKKMKPELEGVPETMLIPLWARAFETKMENPIVKDERALEMIEKIDYDFEKFEKAWQSQVGVAIRTMILDRETTGFVRNYPYSVVINLGAGLDTRFFRTDNGSICWYDLDLPKVINIKKNFFPESDRYIMLAKSVMDYSWINDIDISKRKVLIIAEGLLMYFKEDDVRDLLNKLVTSFPGAEMLIEIMSPAMAKNTKRHDSVSNMGAKFKWGIKGGKLLESYNKNIKFINEWNYFAFHKNRWRWMKWLALIPALRNLNNKIAHLKFL